MQRINLNAKSSMVVHCQGLSSPLSLIVTAPNTCAPNPDPKTSMISYIIGFQQHFGKTNDNLKSMYSRLQQSGPALIRLLTDGVDVAPVGLDLWVLERITVHLAGAG